MHKPTTHQKKQIEVINRIQKLFKKNKVSAVSGVGNYETDPRLCLTSVHLPKKNLLDIIDHKIIKPLRKIPGNSVYFYQPDSLHLTIKNIRVVDNPPNFTKNEVVKVKEMFSKIVPKHNSFNVYYHKLIILPNSLSLMCTTDPSFDDLFIDLDKNLKKINIPDDKIYANKKYFICNMTIGRFNKPVNNKFIKEVNQISKTTIFEKYTIDSINLATANAVLKQLNKIKTWKLQ